MNRNNRRIYARLGVVVVLVWAGLAIHISSLKLANVMYQAGMAGSVSSAEIQILTHPLTVNKEIAHQAYLDGLYMTAASAEAAIRQNPSNALAHQRLGEDLAGHDTSRAIGEFRTTLRLQPGNEMVEFELAYELARTGKIEEAKAIYTSLATKNDRWGQSARRHLQSIALKG